MKPTIVRSLSAQRPDFFTFTTAGSTLPPALAQAPRRRSRTRTTRGRTRRRAADVPDSFVDAVTLAGPPEEVAAGVIRLARQRHDAVHALPGVARRAHRGDDRALPARGHAARASGRAVTVTIIMHGTLRRFLPDGAARATLDLRAGATIEELLVGLGAEKDTWLVARATRRSPSATPCSRRATYSTASSPSRAVQQVPRSQRRLPRRNPGVAGAGSEGAIAPFDDRGNGGGPCLFAT